MKVIVNGESVETQNRSLHTLKQEYCKTTAELVTIIEGFQTDENLALYEGAQINFIEKGKLPSEKELESMLYARHTPKVHQKVKTARVAVAGLGGLGSHIAITLARTGVGCLHLVDFDIVEPSNLNRQQYRVTDLGLPKTDALKSQIKEINPFISVITDFTMVTEENAESLFREDFIVCEAFDRPEAKAMLVNTLRLTCPDKKIVAASGMAGYESSNCIHTRKISNNFYLCGDGQTGAKIGRGLMAPRVSICAGHQANMVLRLILGEDEV